MQPLIKFKCAEEHFQEGWAKMIPQCCERLLVIKKYYLKLLVLKVSLQSVVSDVVSEINFHRESCENFLFCIYYYA